MQVALPDEEREWKLYSRKADRALVKQGILVTVTAIIMGPLHCRIP